MLVGAGDAEGGAALGDVLIYVRAVLDQRLDALRVTYTQSS